jgi:hypothetical protein
MWDIFWERMFRADAAGIDGRCFASFGECIIAGVEIFTFLELFGQMVGFAGKFAIETEESLLIRGKGCNIDLILLQRIHLEDEFSPNL